MRSILPDTIAKSVGKFAISIPTILQKSKGRSPHGSIYAACNAAAKMAVTDSGIDMENLEHVIASASSLAPESVD